MESSQDTDLGEPFSSPRLHSGPSSQSFAPSTKIPEVKVGTTLLPPGDWAAYVKRLPWACAARGDEPKSELLRELVQLPARHELMMRHGDKSRWSPSGLHDLIGSKLPNAEAALMQVVGTKVEVACKHCRQKDGPFAHCVTVHGTPECANCHWGGNAARCSFSLLLPTKKGRRLIYSDNQRKEWQKKLEGIEEEQQRLADSNDALLEKLIDIRTKNANVLDAFTELAIPGSSESPAEAYRKGRKEMRDADDAVVAIHKELQANGKALVTIQREANSLIKLLL
ncbi:uncharacterized protein N7459_008698 [Penicillium hispanicum]|uniref:uncharacterized protein n=1 Tax=Penicillium hispanicum TaxID=1080232 RepID=UPI002541DC31|nr:uncharacterized protein N7459_008698 [Penicillium hispanicum]KAJ5574271.1 hypothetical protein N7459_008698 [Penicillium hispanicum]